MKFSTPYDEIKREPQKLTPNKLIYKKVKCKETGLTYLVEDGYEDVNLAIREEAKDVGLENYIKVDKDGNVVAVNEIGKDRAMYGDFTNMPETRAELINGIKDAKELNKILQEETIKQRAIEDEKIRNEEKLRNEKLRDKEIENKKIVEGDKK